MKIQNDLVWGKHTGELFGFVDLGDPDLNYAALKNTNELATHVLVFLVCSIVNPLAYSFATFATSGISVVSNILEGGCYFGGNLQHQSHCCCSCWHISKLQILQNAFSKNIIFMACFLVFIYSL